MGKDQLGEVRGLCEGPICLPPACGPAVLSARAMRLQPGPHGCDAAGWLRARGCPGGAQPPECGFSPAGGRGHQALWHTAMSRERGDSRRGLRGGGGGEGLGGVGRWGLEQCARGRRQTVSPRAPYPNCRGSCGDAACCPGLPPHSLCPTAVWCSGTRSSILSPQPSRPGSKGMKQALKAQHPLHKGAVGHRVFISARCRARIRPARFLPAACHSGRWSVWGCCWSPKPWGSGGD